MRQSIEKLACRRVSERALPLISQTYRHTDTQTHRHADTQTHSAHTLFADKQYIFSEVLSSVASSSKCTGELTFQDVCQGSTSSAPSTTLTRFFFSFFCAPPPPSFSRSSCVRIHARARTHTHTLVPSLSLHLCLTPIPTRTRTQAKTVISDLVLGRPIAKANRKLAAISGRLKREL